MLIYIVKNYERGNTLKRRIAILANISTQSSFLHCFEVSKISENLEIGHTCITFVIFFWVPLSVLTSSRGSGVPAMGGWVNRWLILGLQ